MSTGPAALAQAIIDGGQAPLGEADALPFQAYTDPELFAFEQEQIFRRDWIPVCAERSLSDAGDRFALDLAGEPIVVVRGRDAKLRALSNVCRHRGTPLADHGFGQAARLVCPYHAWSYDDTGALVGVPHQGAVQVARCDHGLAEFAIDVWRGIVFVHLGTVEEPLARRLDGIERHLDGFNTSLFDAVLKTSSPQVWDANWKIVMENGLESYHLFQLHRTTLEPLLPTRGHSYLDGGPSWALTPGQRSREAEAERWPATSAFARQHYLVAGVPPSLYSGLTVEGWALVLVHPLSPTRTSVSSIVLAPSEPVGRLRRLAVWL